MNNNTIEHIKRKKFLIYNVLIVAEWLETKQTTSTYIELDDLAYDSICIEFSFDGASTWHFNMDDEDTSNIFRENEDGDADYELEGVIPFGDRAEMFKMLEEIYNMDTMSGALK